MEESFKININKLNYHLENLQKAQNRTDWELTIFTANLNKIQNNWEIIIYINDNTWIIKINWNERIPNNFYYLPTWYQLDASRKLYHQVKSAIKEAKSYWIFNEIFKKKE